MPPDHLTQFNPRRRHFLRSSAALLAASVGLGALPANAASDQAVPPTPAPPTPSGLLSPLPPWSTWARRTAPAIQQEALELVRPREAWSAAPPVQPYVPHTAARISLHHTGSPWQGQTAVEQYLRNIQAFHTGPQREWEDIAYHFLVDLDGGVWAGRPPTVRGNPSIYYDSTGFVLICFLGDYGAREPAEQQLDSAAKVAAWLVRRFDIRAETISGHRDHAPTRCPGDNLYRLIQYGTFGRRVQALLQSA